MRQSQLVDQAVKIIETKILSDNWYTLKKITFDLKDQKGTWHRQSREAYDRGNGAVVLLYHPKKKTVILTRQFRMPTYLNGNNTGMLIEACAGLLDHDHAENCIRREILEETGYQIEKIQKIFESYMSPGSVTEILHFFIAEYSNENKINNGGGLESEQEDIEVLELSFAEALKWIQTGEIKDAKTIMLLQYAQIHQLFG